jgi:hypothetical protein
MRCLLHSRSGRGHPSRAAYNFWMLRRLLALLLVLATGWSAAAQATGGFAVVALDDHAALHWAGTGHHHHQHDADGDDDGAAYHVDDSAESAQHLLADVAGGAAALVGTCSFDVGHLRPDLPRAGHSPQRSSPFLDGPLRPPRARS